ncbi:MAG: alcohol dehydrogenase catalytic domain-containing protein [Thermoleophilia bacterium]|nr:alcohol dehydrogenase catalytic domain-containing protein [Thermoleophilia bacterium]
MRALVLHGPGDLRLEERPEPVPGPGEVVIAVEAALTCATDAKILDRGAHPALPPLPAPFGHEASGTVSATGPGVRGVREGDPVVVANSAPCGACEACRRGRPGLCEDLVYLSGAYAELLPVPARIAAANLLPRPPGMPAHIAALTEPVACGVRAAERSAALPGDTVLVLGGGPQGQAITAALAARGCEVVVCDPHAHLRDLARRMGAADALRAPRDPGAEAEVLARTPRGRGAHAVFAAVADVEAWRQGIRLVAPGGEVNLHGGPPAGAVLSTPAAPLHYREITLQASYHHTPAAIRAALALLAGGLPFGELLGAGRIRLEAVEAALRAGGPKRIVDPRAGAGS